MNAYDAGLSWQIITGDAGAVLDTLPDGIVQCVVTSPPYMGARDYGVNGQLGHESAVDCLGWARGNECGQCYICHLVNVLRKTKRVLRDDGVVWLNIDDMYYNYRPGGVSQTKQSITHHDGAVVSHSTKRNGTFEGIKDLMLIPARLELALQMDGWVVRSIVIWGKENCKPESVKDRPSKTHEYVLFLSKKPQYFSDFEAIKEPAKAESIARSLRGVSGATKHSNGAPGQSKESLSKPRKHVRFGGIPRDGVKLVNSKSVWMMATKTARVKHFAMFPLELAERCIKAGSKAGDIILDPFSGSGTSGVAALLHGRKYIGIELNPAYSRLSKRRIGLSVGVTRQEFEGTHDAQYRMEL